KTQTALAFKEALRGIDVLVIDDLQFLQGKSTQAEFCHTLNALIDAGRQVVIAADRPPSDLESLDDRVRSRLAGGLVVEMGSLGEEWRLGILRSRVAAARAHHASFDVPELVLEYLSRTITHNGRDLEGAINRLLAHSKLNAQPVTLEMAEREVRDLIRPQEPKRIKIEDIQRVVARQYNVSRSDLLSSRRTANVVRPRQVAMYLAKTLTLRSLPEIGRRFGGRDHTTVLHAVRKIEGLVGHDMARAEEIEILKRQLQEEAGAYDRRKGPVRGSGGVFLLCGGLWTPGDMPPRPKRALAKNARFRHLCSPASHSASAGLPLRLVSWVVSKAPERDFHESYRRACRTFEVAGPRPSRGRTTQYHSNSRQRPGEGRPRQVESESDRS